MRPEQIKRYRTYMTEDRGYGSEPVKAIGWAEPLPNGEKWVRVKYLTGHPGTALMHPSTLVAEVAQ